MTPERRERLHQVLKQRQPDLTLITDHVHKGRNLSAIIRSADAVGISDIYSIIDDADYHAFRGTAKGSHQWVKVHRKPTFATAIEPLKQQGYQVVAADVGDSSIDYREVDYRLPTVLVLGAEKKGLSDIARGYVDQCITVPMVGMVESFNVSVAAGIILAEALHQRKQAGFYDHQRVSDTAYQQLFFEWGHPKIAAYCQEKGLSYPPLDDEGEIVNAAGWYAQTRELLRCRESSS